MTVVLASISEESFGTGGFVLVVAGACNHLQGLPRVSPDRVDHLRHLRVDATERDYLAKPRQDSKSRSRASGSSWPARHRADRPSSQRSKDTNRLTTAAPRTKSSQREGDMRRARVLSQVFTSRATFPRGCFWHLCVAGGQRPSTALVLLKSVALMPLAHASAGESSWIPGIYDAADGDDAIWVLTEPSTTASCAPTDVTFFPIVARHVFPAIPRISSLGSARAFHLRSPPDA